jgi:hypothetical protein
MRQTLRALILGFKDGWDQPWDLTIGWTFDSMRLNTTFDYAANAGQWTGRLLRCRAFRFTITHPIPFKQYVCPDLSS